MIYLPKQYRDPIKKIFKYEIDFFVPGFEKNYPIGRSKVFSIKNIKSDIWYNEFVNKVEQSIKNKVFMPICRMSDGEFHFALGEPKLDVRLNIFQRIRMRLSMIKEKFFLKGGIGPFTVGHYHSGRYSAEEWQEAKKRYPKLINKIAKKGIVAWHLNYEQKPFHERYFPNLSNWILKNKIKIDEKNYYPFYFVYALLTGNEKKILFKNRNILIINGADGSKKKKIIDGISKNNPKKVYYKKISSDRSLYDKISIDKFIGKVDFVIIGAGIGKPNIMVQLEKLNVPCIDAGFIFEVWANTNKWNRSFCISDDDFLNSNKPFE